MDKIIQLTEKKLSLLKELKNCLIYEQCTHTIEKNIGLYDNYFLICIESKKIIFDGNLLKIQNYCEKRNIKNIYKNNI